MNILLLENDLNINLPILDLLLIDSMDFLDDYLVIFEN